MKKIITLSFLLLPFVSVATVRAGCHGQLKEVSAHEPTIMRFDISENGQAKANLITRLRPPNHGRIERAYTGRGVIIRNSNRRVQGIAMDVQTPALETMKLQGTLDRHSDLQANALLDDGFGNTSRAAFAGEMQCQDR